MASLIIQSIGQAANAAEDSLGNAQATSNWLTLIGAAASEAHRLMTGLPLHLEDGVICPQLDEVSHD